MDTSLTWPPPFTLTKHPRCKHVRLKASAQKGLELVVPLRFNPKEVTSILDLNRSWIEKQLLRIQEKRSAIQAGALPTEIVLAFSDAPWKIIYIASESNKVRLHFRPQQEVIVLGDVQNKALCQKALLTWIKKQTVIYLTKRLQEISWQTGLSFTDLSIRNQRRRWGSCSHDKMISLNYKLVFLPGVLVDHVMIHELCHTLHLNHSTRFWRKVASFDEQWREHVKTLKMADDLIPAWVDAEF